MFEEVRMVKFKRALGVAILMSLLAISLVAALGSSALAAPNEGGVVVGEGDAPDCVGGSCGGVIVEDPHGSGPNCDWGNCGGSICAGSDCGSCVGGNCGGSISGDGKEAKEMKEVKEAPAPARARALPVTGVTLPMASTVALGLGLLLVGSLFTFMGNPSARLAMAIKGYRPRRRA